MVAVASALSGYFFAISPFSRTYSPTTFEVSYRDRLIEKIERLIPQEASLCATFRAAAHFAVREHLYLYPVDFDPSGYPENLGDPDYILLDFAENWTHPGAVVPGRDVLWEDPQRRLLYAQEGFLLYGRGRNNAQEVLRDLMPQEPRPRRPLEQECGFGVVLVGTDSAIDPGEAKLLRVTYYWLLTQPLDRQLFVTVAVRQGNAPAQHFYHMLANGAVPPSALRVGEVFTQTNALELTQEVTDVPIEVRVLGLAVVPEAPTKELATDFKASPSAPGPSPPRSARPEPTGHAR